jgi:hypothetical protein
MKWDRMLGGLKLAVGILILAAIAVLTLWRGGLI